ncbi:hypothetical protein GCM10011444_00650 [Winogradskyella haliclonae]|uniref:Uncharacterized protein n=2 Tax=Winogradskyella haliclonae TaxID=2048558 RepID=A0ABQ2BV84_9FLAO|nr:hypothetical protein GCM10011444_00650 [Winogradskyella haliclonae]
MLNGERQIYRVEIFNPEFSKEIHYKSKSVKVPIDDLPVGRYTVLVRLHDKLIAINLIRKEPFYKAKPKDFNFSINTKAKVLTHVEERSNSANSIHNTKENSAKRNSKIIQGYWVVKTSQGHIGTKITRHFATAQDLENLISKIKLEQNTLSGRYNTLNIWEVYNLDAFKEAHSKNRNYIKVTDSPYFNHKPYYSYLAEVEKRP